jgi:hypothetical protein
MDSFTYIFVMSLRLIFKVELELEQTNHIFEGINLPFVFHMNYMESFAHVL